MELNEKDLENVLGRADSKAVDAIEEGYTKTFRDKVLEDRFCSHQIKEADLENVLGGADPKVFDAIEEGYTKTFRDKVLESKLNEMHEEERTHHR